MESTLEHRRKEKQEIVDLMIRIYCKGMKHSDEQGLCDSCQELRDYTAKRTAKCTYVEESLFCQNCKTPCYAPDMREKITEVMRYSGPRMIFHRPIVAIQHLIALKKEKKQS